MREAIHTPVYIPHKMEGGGYALQEVKLINCASAAPRSYASRTYRGGMEILQPSDDNVDTIPTTDQMSGARLQYCQKIQRSISSALAAMRSSTAAISSSPRR